MELDIMLDWRGNGDCSYVCLHHHFDLVPILLLSSTFKMSRGWLHQVWYSPPLCAIPMSLLHGHHARTHI